MEPLTAEDVLQLWERGERLRPPARTLALLARARRGVPAEALQRMTIGESELALLRLRMSTFGTAIGALDSCPGCGVLVEVSLDADTLLAVGTMGAGVGEGTGVGEGSGSSARRQVTVSAEGRELRFRLPTVGDLAALEQESDPGAARRRLLERCLQDPPASEGLEPVVADLRPDVQARIAAAMDEADPAAQLTTTLRCPDCHRSWESGIDIAAMFWRELVVLARRLLREVHELASRYGWTEGEILRLSAVRRHAYLEGRWA